LVSGCAFVQAHFWQTHLIDFSNFRQTYLIWLIRRCRYATDFKGGETAGTMLLREMRGMKAAARR
jgi:hypothetical protein